MNPIAVTLLALCSAGCISTGSVQRAETLGHGNFELGVEPGLYVQVVPRGYGPTWLPNMNASMRFGIGDRVDVGGRIGLGFFELTSKVMLTDRGSPVVASVAPSVQSIFVLQDAYARDVFALNRFGFLNVALPVLIGVKLGRHEVTVGPRILNLMLLQPRGATHDFRYTLGVGASLGFSARVTELFELMPEASIAVLGFSAATGSASWSNTMANPGQVLVNVTLGIKFHGGPR